MRVIQIGVVCLLLLSSALAVRRHVNVKKTEPVAPAKADAPVVNAAAKNLRSTSQAAPAPAPAPITQTDIVKKMKEKMAKKVGHYDADYVLDRPTTVPPGHDGQMAPGPKTNLVPNAKPVKKAEGAAGAPGAAPAPAPAPVPDTGMTEAALNPLVKHNDNETMTDDWGAEYGPKGPKGVHGPYQPMAGHQFSGASSTHHGIGLVFALLATAVLVIGRS